MSCYLYIHIDEVGSISHPEPFFVVQSNLWGAVSLHAEQVCIFWAVRCFFEGGGVQDWGKGRES